MKVINHAPDRFVDLELVVYGTGERIVIVVNHGSSLLARISIPSVLDGGQPFDVALVEPALEEAP